ncbi:MAG: hypothetical protein FWD60_09925 [Candidatus Azobacteroides sp.]|nr:hypothetical protein [Candidatus Azobacteroides sp.]
MATYQIQINERTSLGKSIVTLLHSVPQAVMLKKTEEKIESEFNLYDSLDRAFADVRLMIDGKKKKKTAQEFLEEIRNGK